MGGNDGIDDWLDEETWSTYMSIEDSDEEEEDEEDYDEEVDIWSEQMTFCHLLKLGAVFVIYNMSMHLLIIIN